MSLIFQNMTASTQTAAKTTGAGLKVGAVTAVGTNSLAAFGSSLTQFMSGGEGQQASAMNGAAALLEGLLQNMLILPGEDNAGNPEQAVSDWMQGMIGDTDKLDEAIAEDPQIMAALQSWLQQATALLQSLSSANEDTAGAEIADAGGTLLNSLAEDPTTIRFAVQDKLSQLVSVLQKADMPAGAPVQAVQLLESFQNVVQEAVPTGRSKIEANGSTASAGTISKVSPQLLQSLSGGQDGLRLFNGSKPQEGGSEAAKTLFAIKSNMLPGIQAATDNAAAQQKVNPSTSDAPDAVETEDQLKAPSTVTAGHLVMKEGIQAPIKAAAPVVHAQSFAKEMTAFVVNKLDIVKQDGLSEAKISLYPEHLGQVDIKLTMQNGQLIAQFTTEHAGAKDLLEQQMSQLRSSLQSQGVQVEKLVVTQNTSLQSQMYHDGRQPNSGQQQSNRRSKDQGEAAEDSLTVAELGDELNDWLAQQQEEQGNSFTAKA